jgi:hypothetical protein
MSECAECGATENLEEHHIEYATDTTVTLCLPCHNDVHSDASHELHPVDSPKEASIRVDESTRDRLKEYGSMGDTYDDVINRALDVLDDD